MLSHDAIAASGRLSASFTLGLDAWRQPIRVDQLAEAVIVHMMKKGLLGKAKPSTATSKPVIPKDRPQTMPAATWQSVCYSEEKKLYVAVASTETGGQC